MIAKVYYIKVILILLVFILFNNTQAAQSKKILDPNNAALIIDYNTGLILHQENASELRDPASLTKMMTLYLTFYNLKNGNLKLNQILTTSKNASSMPRTNLDLKVNDKITVKDSILGLIIKSANDASVVLAEHIAGTEEKFAKLMNKQAKKLGMHKTNFKNSHGLTHKKQKTTAIDMAKLSIALKKDFPQYYKLFSKTEFIFNGITYKSHNRVTSNVPWVDGIKTGYTKASGFNIVSATNFNGIELIGVVLGGKSAIERDQKVISLLNKNLFSPFLKRRK